MPDTSLMFYNEVNNGKYECQTYIMEENELVIFRSNDQLHGGNKYNQENVRLFGNIMSLTNHVDLEEVYFESNKISSKAVTGPDNTLLNDRHGL